MTLPQAYAVDNAQVVVEALIVQSKSVSPFRLTFFLQFRLKEGSFG